VQLPKIGHVVVRRSEQRTQLSGRACCGETSKAAISMYVERSEVKRVIVVGFLSDLLLILFSATASTRSSSSRENIKVEAQRFAVPDDTGLGVFAATATGDLAGSSISGHLTVANSTAGGITMFAGSHTFVTLAFGVFTTSDTVISTPAGRLNAVFEITDGASGVIHAHGTVDSAGNISRTYHGRVCG
jgi:hypothetical protein